MLGHIALKRRVNYVSQALSTRKRNKILEKLVRAQFILSALVLALTTSIAANADSIPYPNAGTLATSHHFTAVETGDLVGYFFGSSAAYDNQIGVFVNGTQLGGYGLDNQSSTIGQSVNFGHVNAGDTIVFALNVLSQGYKLYSNTALNSDSMDHAYATVFSGQAGGGVSIPAGIYVGFEDQLATISDLDYNDESLVFTNVAITTNPEPVSFVLFGTGLLTLGLFRRKRV